MGVYTRSKNYYNENTDIIAFESLVESTNRYLNYMNKEIDLLHEGVILEAVNIKEFFKSVKKWFMDLIAAIKRKIQEFMAKFSNKAKDSKKIEEEIEKAKKENKEKEAEDRDEQLRKEREEYDKNEPIVEYYDYSGLISYLNNPPVDLSKLLDEFGGNDTISKILYAIKDINNKNNEEFLNKISEIDKDALYDHARYCLVKNDIIIGSDASISSEDFDEELRQHIKGELRTDKVTVAANNIPEPLTTLIKAMEYYKNIEGKIDSFADDINKAGNNIENIENSTMFLIIADIVSIYRHLSILYNSTSIVILNECDKLNGLSFVTRSKARNFLANRP